MKIVYMGTPDFAKTCLERILCEGYEIVGVFTQPDRPKGRSGKPAPPPTKELALEHNIPVFQPEKLRDGTALAILQELAPDVIVVVAYGRILPPDILTLPKHGCINVHASLLPRYRGAAPIQWSVINGDDTTGVCTMFMDEGMDTGDIILTHRTPIDKNETSGELFRRLSAIGADCLANTLDILRKGDTLPRTVQEHTQATHAPMLTKDVGRLDFTKSAKTLHNLVRGCSPWPGAHTRLRDKMLKVHECRPMDEKTSAPCGTLLQMADKLCVACGDGDLIELISVQLEGKSRVSGADFLRGFRLTDGEVLGE